MRGQRNDSRSTRGRRRGWRPVRVQLGKGGRERIAEMFHVEQFRLFPK